MHSLVRQFRSAGKFLPSRRVRLLVVLIAGLFLASCAGYETYFSGSYYRGYGRPYRRHYYHRPFYYSPYYFGPYYYSPYRYFGPYWYDDYGYRPYRWRYRPYRYYWPPYYYGYPWTGRPW